MTLLEPRPDVIDAGDPLETPAELAAPLERRGSDGIVPAGRAYATVLLGLLLAALLCADSLERVALRQPYGPGRDLALDIVRPLQSASHAFGLHLPRLWLAELAGNTDPPVSASGVPVSTLALAPTTTTTAMPKPGATIPIPTTTTLPPRRVPTVESPLRVWLGGDSLMGTISAGYGRLVRNDPRVAVVGADFRVGTGLARPDVLDWPAYLNQQLATIGPEVVVLTFGNNDDQDMLRPDGSRAVLASPEWVEEYGRRVGLLMDVATAGDRTVVWIGLPAERPEGLNHMAGFMNSIAQGQAAMRPRVRYVDAGAVLSPSGTYTDVVTMPDGSQVRARERDGVHLTHAGADLLAPSIHAAYAADWNLG